MLIIEFIDESGCLRLETFQALESNEDQCRVNGHHVTREEYGRVRSLILGIGCYDIREHPRFIVATWEGVSGT